MNGEYDHVVTVAINGRFLIDSFGGIKRFATELTERLSRARGDVVLLVPRGAADVSIPGVTVEVVGRFGGPLWEQVELPLWLATHGRPMLLNFAGVAPIAYARQVSVLHDISPALRPRDFSLPFRIQWQLAVRWGMLRRGQLVTDSAASQREIAEYFGVPEDRIRVIHLGADSFPPVRGTTESPPSAPRFVAFGRHGQGKNVRVIIDALATLADSDIVVEFVGKLDPQLEPYAIEKGVPSSRIAWRGPVSDDELAKAFDQATAMIWPSTHEGFGLPPLEAQSLGTAVIASDIPVNREILADSVLYFPATDASALATRMIELSTDDSVRAHLADLARENAARFTWDRTTSVWLGLIRAVQGESTPH